MSKIIAKIKRGLKSHTDEEILDPEFTGKITEKDKARIYEKINSEFQSLIDGWTPIPKRSSAVKKVELYEKQEQCLQNLTNFFNRHRDDKFPTFNPNYTHESNESNGSNGSNGSNYDLMKIFLINGKFNEAGHLIEMPNFRIKYPFNQPLKFDYTMKSTTDYPEDEKALKMEEKTRFMMKARDKGYSMIENGLFSYHSMNHNGVVSFGSDLVLNSLYPLESDECGAFMFTSIEGEEPQCACCHETIVTGEYYFGNICFHMKHRRSPEDRYSSIDSDIPEHHCALHMECSLGLIKSMMNDIPVSPNGKNHRNHKNHDGMDNVEMKYGTRIPKCPHNPQNEIQIGFIEQMIRLFTDHLQPTKSMLAKKKAMEKKLYGRRGHLRDMMYLTNPVLMDNMTKLSLFNIIRFNKTLTKDEFKNENENGDKSNFCSFSDFQHRLFQFVMRPEINTLYFESIEKLIDIGTIGLNTLYCETLFMDHPQKTACPSNKCTGFILMDPDEERFETCPKCQKRQKFEGRNLKPMTIEEKQTINDQIKLSNGQIQACPKCKRLIEKDDGCNNMHCTFCDKPFKWHSEHPKLPYPEAELGKPEDKESSNSSNNSKIISTIFNTSGFFGGVLIPQTSSSSNNSQYHPLGYDTHYSSGITSGIYRNPTRSMSKMNLLVNSQSNHRNHTRTRTGSSYH